jgi:hypothetical protein
VSNLLVIGDNYETEVIFLISGFQYVVRNTFSSFSTIFSAAKRLAPNESL